jgi:phage tail sheath protein FI
MTRPGVVVSLRDTPSALSLSIDSGTAFVVGLSDMGPTNTARQIQSLQQFVTVYGARQAYSSLYDAVETFFREGGDTAYIGRVVGPAATSGFKNLPDAGAATSLVATAIGPGAWSSSYKIAVVAGVASGSFKIQVTDASNVVLEDSGDLLTQAAAVNWSQFSNFIRITLGASTNNPANAAAAALSAGADDRNNVTDAQWANALNLFSKELGPGQVFAPGRTTAAGQGQLITHAENNNRVALIDLVDSPTSGTLIAAATPLNSRFAAAFAPWVVIPGATGGVPRTVPPSAFIAGLVARNDPALGPNRPAAGNAGGTQYVTDLSQPAWDDLTRETLNNNTVNVIRRMFNGIRNYGWRSLTDPVGDLNWLDFGNARLHMEISAELSNVGENYMFDEIDGQNGNTISFFHSEIGAVMLDHFTARELFGDAPEQAFSVDTGPAVNTLQTIANNELHAVVNYRAATMAEWVKIEIVKTQVTQTIS